MDYKKISWEECTKYSPIFFFLSHLFQLLMKASKTHLKGVMFVIRSLTKKTIKEGDFYVFFVFSGFVLILLWKSRIARHVTDNININIQN